MNITDTAVLSLVHKRQRKLQQCTRPKQWFNPYAVGNESD